MTQIELRGVQKFFGEVQVVRDLNLAIADNEFIVLLGQSGCGKTTTLRAIAGLETIDEGDILIDGAPVPQRVRHVLAHRHVRPDRVGLEHHADVPQPRRDEETPLRRGDHVPADRDLAPGRVLEAGDAAQRGGLAAARRAEQADEFSVPDREIDIGDGVEGAEALGHISEFDRGHEVTL